MDQEATTKTTAPTGGDSSLTDTNTNDNKDGNKKEGVDEEEMKEVRKVLARMRVVSKERNLA